ncbi:MAG TPA: L,D-transpeptidase family protein [Bacteroidia bacterium]|jgi:murein L,D-transpeptidase YcbB/YkuD
MQSFRQYHIYLSLFATLTIISCNKCSDEKPKEIVLVEKPEMVNEEIAKLLDKKLSQLDTSSIIVIKNDSLYSTRFILDFYTKNNHTAAFTDKGKLTKQGDTLLDVIKNADVYGLFPEDYHYQKIDSLLKTARDSASQEYDAVKLLNADLLLADAFFSMAVHVNKGRLNADSLTYEWKGAQLDTNVVDILYTVIAKNSIRSAIDSLEPANNYYQRLKQALKDFKFEFKDTSWDSLASRNSDSVTFMTRVKERLIKSHDYFDEFSGSDSIKLMKSIKNFQCKHNLTEDGKIGKLTFKAMQRTKQDYIDQIALNMERWRWSRVPTEKQYVWVNIPKYEMRVIEDDTVAMKSRVIVGAPDHQTPLLKSTIRYFLIYPYWTVPFSIATKEILPILKRDTSYLRRKRFEVLDGNNQKVDPTTINWKRYSKNYFPWKLRQAIGEDNSLGILKFNFENKYGVYMHDTDSRRLFGREMRAMSHGCCRLEKFMDFAKFLIRDDSIKYPVDSLISDTAKHQQKYVYLKKPIPIYINYFTVEVGDYFERRYFIDVYKRDEKMLKALRRKNKKN